MSAYRFGSPFAVHVSRDVSNNELRATLIDCMQDMFKDSAFSQVDVTFKILEQNSCKLLTSLVSLFLLEHFLSLLCTFECIRSLYIVSI